MNNRKAFTLVEMLLVIGIISVLAAMVISNFSNAAQDTRRMVSRQQQAVVQEALNAWVSRNVGRIATGNAQATTVSDVRAAYNAAANVTARFTLFSGYLEPSSKGHFSTDDSTSRLTSDPMRSCGQYLTLPDWGAGEYPRVNLN